MSVKNMLPLIDNPISETVQQSVSTLLNYCRNQHWQGYDPYDGLNSRVFQSSPFLHSRWPRLILTQGLKRSPINLRQLLRVAPGLNPKGVALFTSALLRLDRAGLTRPDEARTMADCLVSLRTPGWPNACWGYNFDWQTRTYLVPRGYPNIICTSFAGEALLDAYENLGDKKYLECAIEAGEFILKDLKRTELDDSFCFSYTPQRETQVHNASLLGAALLARLNTKTDNHEFRDAASAAARYGIRHQLPDGSWIYGESPHQGWIDSFHTGYNLIALRSLAEHLTLTEAEESVQRGFKYYREAFFARDGVVKYFNDRVYPIDVHAVAHALLTLIQLSDLDSGSRTLAHEIVDWSARNLQSPTGFYYYQKRPWFTNRICYMRWGQAWMLRGLSEFYGREDSA